MSQEPSKPHLAVHHDHAAADDQAEAQQVRRFLMWLVPLALLSILALWLTIRTVMPPPQKRLVMTTGSEAGAYHAISKRYKASLAKSGITLDLKTSAGSAENLMRLQDPKSGVSVRLLQGGISDEKASPDLISVGRMFYEPLWIFYRANETLDRISQLKGKRIAIGADGSGTQTLAKAMLGANKITDKDAAFLPLARRRSR